ncbi:hypothetical protein PGQ11_006305 [Apiospora arundinis]|uniref:HD domain-containing protein n=1 Tax=Apiospora arundinis TaxID=335852 RepID=A0ABR2ISB7_9PEZI
MAISKMILLLPCLLSRALVATASPVSSASSHSSSYAVGYDHASSYPNRTIAGVTVVDTPVVRAAHTYAREHTSDFVYNHVMRGWLFGALIWQHQVEQHEGGNNGTRTNAPEEFDIEVHAVAALLHDLGWDQTPRSPLISPDRRFEVDGAIASREFLQHYHGNNGSSDEDHHHLVAGTPLPPQKPWDHHRTQLVWDSIALHTTDTIFPYKEPEVRVVGQGIWMDFSGPALGVTEGEYAAVVAQFPRAGFREGVNETLIWLCASKPQTTYDTFMQPFGEHYLANYSAKGHQAFDIIQNVSD